MGFQFTVGSYNFRVEKFHSNLPPERLFTLLEEKFGKCFQIFNSEFLFYPEQLISAVSHAIRSFERRENVARELRVEIILYLSGKRQIKEAVDLIGYKGGEGFLLLWARGEIPKEIEVLELKWSEVKKEKLLKMGFKEEEIKASGENWKNLPLECPALLEMSK